jgi:(2Fe-2S) ferredoxin
VTKTDVLMAAKEVLAGVPEEDKLELVAKSRFSCESRSMMATVLALGWDEANDMNLQLAQAVGEAEMHRLMELLGWSSPENDQEFMLMVATAMELFAPKKYFDYEFKLLEPGKGLGIVTSCLACAKVKSLGVESLYRCGCFGMRRGWYEAMGVEVAERLVTSMLDGDERCEILVEQMQYPRKQP